MDDSIYMFISGGTCPQYLSCSGTSHHGEEIPWCYSNLFGASKWAGTTLEK